MTDYFSYLLLEKAEALKRIFTIAFLCMTANSERHMAFLLRRKKNVLSS